MPQARLEVFDLAGKIGDLHLFGWGIDNPLRFVVIIYKRKHAVILFLFQRIELVIMALRALYRNAEHAFTNAIHPVEHGIHAKLLWVHAALLVDHRVTQKTRGYDLILRRIGELVTGKLFDDKLVVG